MTTPEIQASYPFDPSSITASEAPRPSSPMRFYRVHSSLLSVDVIVEIEEDGGEVVASDSFLEVYGAGETVDEAIREFLSMVVDTYRELSRSESVLSRSLKNQLDRLRRVLSV